MSNSYLRYIRQKKIKVNSGIPFFYTNYVIYLLRNYAKRL
jgi:hypothetical protein